MKHLAVESKEILMMKYNQYPLNIEEIEENNEELYVKSENEIQIGTGDSKKIQEKKCTEF